MELWTNWWPRCRAILNSAARNLALFLISIYRLTLSGWIGPVCRFQPTCSCYAQEAFETHSAHYAFWLTLRRLLKCHPLGPFGYDPVPKLQRKTS